jgi:hypothetical protein
MIYCVGLPKTGTTSLKEALKILGFKEGIDFHVGDYVYWMDKSDGTKFILTYRLSDDWYRSVKRWSIKKIFDPWIILQRKRMYGYYFPHFHKRHFIHFFVEHTMKMRFLYAPLEMNLNIHGWHELCRYLDKPVPDVKFPHLNKHDNIKISSLSSGSG